MWIVIIPPGIYKKKKIAFFYCQHCCTLPSLNRNLQCCQNKRTTGNKSNDRKNLKFLVRVQRLFKSIVCPSWSGQINILLLNNSNSTSVFVEMSWTLVSNLLFLLLGLLFMVESKNVNLPVAAHDVPTGSTNATLRQPKNNHQAAAPDPDPFRITFSIRPKQEEKGGGYDFRLTFDTDDEDTDLKRVVNKAKDVNQHKPIFSECDSYSPRIEEEESNGTLVIRVQATDADKGVNGQITYSIVQQPDQIESKFVIDEDTGEIYSNKVFDREGGDDQFESVTVKATDQGDPSLEGVCSFIVEIVDINDNAPRFPHRVYLGNVTENSKAGIEVMTMAAVDDDDPNEGFNTTLTYSIEKNVIDEITGLPIFEIESATGVIKTAVPGLDREKTPYYSIEVVAMDGGGLKGTGTASIRVDDVNDMPPKFTKSEWYTEVDETDGITIPKSPILTVSVHDEDETNNFHYKVVKSSGLWADKFTMVRNKDGTGSLKLIQPLDYADKLQRSGIRFMIQVSDKGDDNSQNKYYVAYSWVTVKLRNTNENKLRFDAPNIETSVYENAEVGQTLETFRATKLDGGKVSYAIDRESDRLGQFAIDRHGTVTIQRHLDRENTPRHQVNILAIDESVPPKTATATLNVVVRDINDNAPRFLKDYRPVLPEHTSPRKIIEILATDDDDRLKGNGPPFHFQMDPDADVNIQTSFKVEYDPKGANGDGTAIVTSLRSFDREQQKEFHVPIIIKDSGSPAMSATSTLTVIIGDINDNKMKAGSKKIVVYNYMGQLSDTEIGRVDVNDLDDWDLPDKKFYWDTEAHQNFTLHQDTGMLTMRRGTPAGKYSLRFRVSDYHFDQIDIPANVTVTVREISHEGVTNSGSIRISGITDEDFIRVWDYKNQDVVESKMIKLRDKLAQLLVLVPTSVDIFSVQLRQQNPPITDIRFSANVPPYYKPTKLNGIVLTDRKDIETEVGINITMVGINECLIEDQSCEGSCTNIMEVSSLPYLINSNKTALVGVQVDIRPECTCGALNLVREESCRNNPCQNDGSCIEGHSEITCECPKGFEGPHCQLTTISFITKNNEWAWFPALEMCESSHLSIEFLAKNLNGTLLYNGPMVPPKPYETILSDFISIELESGNPRLLMNFGSGTLELVLESNDTYQLDDGNWHRIDVFWDTKDVRMVLDFCNSTSELENRTLSDFNTSDCEVKGVVPPFSKYLDVNAPLQIGGMSHPSLDPSQFGWNRYPHGESFNGTIRNVVHNGKIYDLTDQNGTHSLWYLFNVFETLHGWPGWRWDDED